MSTRNKGITVTEYNKNGSIKRRYKLIYGQEPCKKHPKYKAKRKPRVACEQCWRIYFAMEEDWYNF